MSDHGSRPPRPGSTLLFRIMNPELFYTVPKPVLAVGAAVVAVACADVAAAQREHARRHGTGSVIGVIVVGVQIHHLGDGERQYRTGVRDDAH